MGAASSVQVNPAEVAVIAEAQSIMAYVAEKVSSTVPVHDLHVIHAIFM